MTVCLLGVVAYTPSSTSPRYLEENRIVSARAVAAAAAAAAHHSAQWQRDRRQPPHSPQKIHNIFVNALKHAVEADNELHVVFFHLVVLKIF